MSTTNPMRRITEIHNTPARKGFQVRFYGPKPESNWFPIEGTARTSALRQAKRWRDQREQELGLSAADYGTRRPRTSNKRSKANIGVFASVGKKNGRFYGDVLGVLNYTEDGKQKRKQKAFSILNLGYHAAYVAAVEARCIMTNTELPDKVDVPPLDEDKRQLLLEAGATEDLLTRTAIVPWSRKRTRSI